MLQLKLEVEHYYALLSQVATQTNDSSKYKWYLILKDFCQERGDISANLLFKKIACAYSNVPEIPSWRLDCYYVVEELISALKIFSVRQDQQILRHVIEIMIPIARGSLTGVSTVLNLLFPETLPILNIRIVDSWNKLFRTNLALNAKNKVNTYLHYWEAMVEWSNNCADLVEPSPTVDDLERLLYRWNGGKF